MKPRLWPPASWAGMRVRQPRGAELVAEHALDDQGQAEGEQQAVEVVEVVEALEHRALEDDAEHAHHERREEQRPPVAEPDLLQQEVGHEGAHHVLGAVGEVDDVEQPEDDRQPEAQQRVEGAVDQPDEELTEQGLRRDAESIGIIRRPEVCGRLLLLHQRAVALVERAEGLLGRDRRADLVVVPRRLRLGRLLDLEQVGGVDLAAVGADRPLAEQRIVGAASPSSWR